ncbi:MAG: membrane-bound lytic murein transglycosylase MltF [Enterobacteriaceae bacterium]
MPTPEIVALTTPIRKLTCFSKQFLTCVPLIVGLMVWSQHAGQENYAPLLQIKQQGTLRMGTLLSPLTYMPTQKNSVGLDYELAKKFADFLHTELQVKVYDSPSELFAALHSDQVDFIAAGLVYNQERQNEFTAGPAYYSVSQQLVYRQGGTQPRSLKEISSRLVVAANSNPASYLQQLKSDQADNLLCHKSETLSTQDLLKAVADGHLDYTVADSVSVAYLQRIYPQLSVAFTINDEEPVVWYTRRSDNNSLTSLMGDFFAQSVDDGSMARLEEKYLGHVGSFDYLDTKAFLYAVDHVLPYLQPLFEKYSEQIHWQLLAAVAYQESHWNPKAVSPTGVRGIMMLTQATADEMGVRNRTDPEQSIRGGAQYLQMLMDKIPASIHADERIWFALAAYNMGFGHMLDARELTRRQGADPNSWVEVKKRLPMLAKRAWYQQTRYGYARGHETYQFVENIRRYIISLNGYLAKQNNDDDLFVMRESHAASF